MHSIEWKQCVPKNSAHGRWASCVIRWMRRPLWVAKPDDKASAYLSVTKDPKGVNNIQLHDQQMWYKTTRYPHIAPLCSAQIKESSRIDSFYCPWLLTCREFNNTSMWVQLWRRNNSQLTPQSDPQGSHYGLVQEPMLSQVDTLPRH